MEDRHRHGDRKYRVTSSGEQRETDSSDERAIRVETRTGTRESVCEKTLQTARENTTAKVTNMWRQQVRRRIRITTIEMERQV